MLPKSDDDEVTGTEEEEDIKDAIVAHPTRDDWHEQRERGQTCEGVLHIRSTLLMIQLASRSTRSGVAPPRMGEIATEQHTVASLPVAANSAPLGGAFAIVAGTVASETLTR